MKLNRIAARIKDITGYGGDVQITLTNKMSKHSLAFALELDSEKLDIYVNAGYCKAELDVAIAVLHEVAHYKTTTKHTQEFRDKLKEYDKALALQYDCPVNHIERRVIVLTKIAGRE